MTERPVEAYVIAELHASREIIDGAHDYLDSKGVKRYLQDIAPRRSLTLLERIMLTFDDLRPSLPDAEGGYEDNIVPGDDG